MLKTEGRGDNVGVWEWERERKRESDRLTDWQTDRQTDRHRDRERDRQTETKITLLLRKSANSFLIFCCTNWQADRQTNRQTDGQDKENPPRSLLLRKSASSSAISCCTNWRAGRNMLRSVLSLSVLLALVVRMLSIWLMMLSSTPILSGW